jgi:hypothetical protein
MMGYQGQRAGFVLQSRNADEKKMGVGVVQSERSAFSRIEKTLPNYVEPDY